jgi:hypothetical protein
VAATALRKNKANAIPVLYLSTRTVDNRRIYENNNRHYNLLLYGHESLHTAYRKGGGGDR